MEKQSAIRYQGLILVLSFIPFLLSWYWWDDLPDRVPIHWNARGEVDGYGPKILNLLLLPGINLFVNGPLCSRRTPSGVPLIRSLTAGAYVGFSIAPVGTESRKLASSGDRSRRRAKVFTSLVNRIRSS